MSDRTEKPFPVLYYASLQFQKRWRCTRNDIT